METLFVITWKYSDGSAFGIVRIYGTRNDAEKDHKMLTENCAGSRQFEICEVEYIEG